MVPGSEGLADLYLMPGYDDIASIYYYGNKWHLHYLAPGSKTVASIRESEAKPLSKANLKRVLEEMKKHAG